MIIKIHGMPPFDKITGLGYAKEDAGGINHGTE
jgi:hypothetical protein